MSDSPDGIGDIGRAVAANIRRWRNIRRMSAQTLADMVTAMGWTIHRSAISDIENGKRRVSVDDLAYLGWVLGVLPADLLAPDQVCGNCHGTPPAGYACLTCGASQPNAMAVRTPAVEGATKETTR